MAIGVMAILILGTLRYSSFKLHEKEVQARRAEASSSQGTSTGSGGGGSYTTPSREMGRQTGDKDNGVDKAENVGYVSLG